MLSQELQKAIRPSSMLTLLVWVGEFLSYGVYYFIAFQAASKGKPDPESLNIMLPRIFMIICGALFIGGVAFKFYLFSQKRAQAFLAKAPEPAQSDDQEMTAEEMKLAVMARQTLQPYLTSLGMINTCAIMGMMLTMIQKDINQFLPFIAAAVAGSMLCYPRMEAFIEESLITIKHSKKNIKEK